MTRSRLLFALCSLLVIGFVGCSDSTQPPLGGSGDGLGNFEGKIDPNDETFVLKTLDVSTDDGLPIRVELIARFIRVSAAGEVVMGISVRNADRANLYAPAEIALSRFNPSSVFPTNPDWTACPEDTFPDSARVTPSACQFGYVYSDLLGDDGVLSAGETSGEKQWFLQDPDLVPFSFEVLARFGLAPDRPLISGEAFNDRNQNGQREADEGPFVGVSIHVSGPDFERTMQVGLEGRYSVHVPGHGLYTVTAFPPPTIFAKTIFTTPNPLQVVILPENGEQSFLHADFGLTTEEFLACPMVLIADEEDSLRLDPYTLVDSRLDGRLLTLRVAFSGCTPDHPLQLFMVGGVMESLPPQVRVVLLHNNRDEMCRAYFTREICFDLTQLLWEADYKTVIVRFEDWKGNVHRFEVHE